MLVCNDFLTPDFLRGLKGIIFDCDGVLFDSKEANIAFYSTLCKRMGLTPPTKEMADYLHMCSVADAMKCLVPEDRLKEAFSQAKALGYDGFMQYMRPAPGLYKMLTLAFHAGFYLGICTNRGQSMTSILDIFDLKHYFDPVMTVLQVPAKPAPDGLHYILQYWGVRPDEVVFVGDSILDAQAAEAVGIKLWAFGSPALPAALHLSDFWCLARQLQRLKAVG